MDADYRTDPDDPEEGAARNYCRYLPLRVAGKSVKALIDSGNSFHTVISGQLAREMGVKSSDLDTRTRGGINTARPGAKLKVIGALKSKIHFTVGKSRQKFAFKPIVVEELSFPIIISGPFLKAHNWDFLVSRNCLRINGKDVPLSNRSEPGTASIFTTEEVTIPGRHIAFIKGVIPAVRRGHARQGIGVATGSLEFMGRSDLHPWRNAVVEVDKTGECKLGVINTRNYPLTVKAGWEYGDFEPCQGETDDGILLLGGDDQESKVCGVGPLTRKDKKDAFIQEALKVASQGPTEEDKQREVERIASFTTAQKKDWLISNFELRKSPFLKDRKDLDQAVDVLLEYWDLFSFDGSYGRTNLIKHRIDLKPGTQPVKMRYKPVSPTLEPELEKQLNKWLKEGVIEPANSPWSANIIAAKKKGGRIRWCIDWR